MRSLGQQWEILNLYFKPYAACRWGQPAVAGALKIVRDHRLTPDRIQGIRVRTFEAAARLPNDYPRDTEEAQYSLAFPVAAALLDGEVGPAQVLPPRLHDPELLSLVDRVSTEVAPEFEAEFPAKAPAEVVVETRDGQTFHSGRIEALWEPPDTLPTDEELGAKFRWLVEPVLGVAQCRELISMLWHFENQPEARTLIQHCRKAL
jgi:2-methylcitrate dehydratase PrpD